ncbi:hypothetical protein [Paenibacillus odorifer]|uniref:hypothetical protein n=1 Tax=Paenibacillus odorifer TaxID=189426 RepID=UPI00096D7283|nr:hypothetical protein [Paenibacillus odorifer]OMD67606.1 hypothetical protein BSK50_30005 [Paenibacillus odorifer]
MKFREINRNYWSDYDYWKGKKNGYIVEIETPYRMNHVDMGKYSYKITSPDGTVKTSIKDKLHFSGLKETCEFVENWIDSR